MQVPFCESIGMKNESLKIAFDAKRITHNKTGLGNYGRYIVRILAEQYPENEYRLYSPGKGKEALTEQLPSVPQITFRYPGTWLPKAFWRSAGIVSDLKKEPPSLYHGLSGELPLGLKQAGIKSVVTVHDLIFLRYPEFYARIDRAIYTWKFRKACLNANRIIAISEMTKRDIIRYFDIPEEKIDVVYQGCDPSFTRTCSREETDTLSAKYNLPSKYILSVGSIESRKNLLLAVKAMRDIPENIHLIAIGKRTEYTQTVETYIRENGLSGRVRLLNNIPFSELPAFYQSASLFVYPSFFEGFGIPIVEALNSGVPVIAATGSCLEEAGGPDSIYVDPTDVRQMTEAIRSVLFDTVLSERMIRSGKEYAGHFAEETVAREMMRVYTHVLNEPV